jgi:hypothetical protein
MQSKLDNMAASLAHLAKKMGMPTVKGPSQGDKKAEKPRPHDPYRIIRFQDSQKKALARSHQLARKARQQEAAQQEMDQYHEKARAQKEHQRVYNHQEHLRQQQQKQNSHEKQRDQTPDQEMGQDLAMADAHQ